LQLCLASWRREGFHWAFGVSWRTKWDASMVIPRLIL
jgi:hypothetical protein